MRVIDNKNGRNLYIEMMAVAVFNKILYGYNFLEALWNKILCSGEECQRAGPLEFGEKNHYLCVFTTQTKKINLKKILKKN